MITSRDIFNYKLTSTAAKVAFVWLDMVIVNLFLFFFIKSLIFHPLRMAYLSDIFLWGFFFVSAIVLLHFFQPWEKKRKHLSLILQLCLFFFFSFAIFKLSTIETTSKGTDFSWLRPEIIKTPMWLRMFIPMSPIFSLLFCVGITFLIRSAVKAPRNWWLGFIPSTAVALLIWLIFAKFSTFNVSSAPGDPGSVIPIYIIMFVGPTIVFTAFIWLRFFHMAFRLVPLLFHTMLILLNYTSILPVQTIWDLVPFADERQAVIQNIPGAELLHPASSEKTNPTFSFLRKMIADKQNLYVLYGPTCGMYAIDRQTGRLNDLFIPGLMRDVTLSPNAENLWCLNWYFGDFIAVKRNPFHLICRQNLFDFGITTPYQLIFDDDRIFISNVTHPIVAQLSLQNPDNPCSLQLEKTIDFYENGFTRFTDGAYGLHFDKQRNRLYTIVGFMEDRFVSALVEIDPDTFTVTRNVWLTAGNPLFPLSDRPHALIPSYYTDEVHEVSLDSMKIIRTLHVVANLVTMEYDEKRGLIYGVSRASGLLAVIDYTSGNTLKKLFVGPKPEAMVLDRATDHLFIGSGLGIISIDLKKFLTAK